MGAKGKVRADQKYISSFLRIVRFNFLTVLDKKRSLWLTGFAFVMESH